MVTQKFFLWVKPPDPSFASVNQISGSVPDETHQKLSKEAVLAITDHAGN